MIIVEGPDGAGKTTLVQMLVEEGMVLQPRACTSDNGIDPATLAEWVDRDLTKEGGTKGHLYDRYPLFSDIIYGPLIRNRVADKFNDIRWYWQRLQQLRVLHIPLVVFCLPPWETVEQNIAKGHKANTEHLMGVLEHARGIYDQYVALHGWVSMSNFDVHLYDYTGAFGDPQSDLSWLKQQAKRLGRYNG